MGWPLRMELMDALCRVILRGYFKERICVQDLGVLNGEIQKLLYQGRVGTECLSDIG